MRFTAQRLKFFIKGFFSKFYQICRKLRIWPHLLKKSLMENFIFCAVIACQIRCFTQSIIIFAERVSRMCSVKKVFLEISQNPQKNICARVSFLIKLKATLLKKRLWHRCFHVNFAKFLRALFLTNTYGGCFCLCSCYKTNGYKKYLRKYNNFSLGLRQPSKYEIFILNKF